MMVTMWAVSFPAFMCLMAALALTEGLWNWFTGLGVIPWLRRRTGRSLSTTAFDEFTAVVNGNKTAELEQRRVEMLLRHDECDGAPPRSSIDLVSGTAFIVLPGSVDTPPDGTPAAARPCRTAPWPARRRANGPAAIPRPGTVRAVGGKGPGLLEGHPGNGTCGRYRPV
ncbi:DUF6191 domain-containing protein [Streptomyces sp. NBC_01210]|uniref:DUF6191 domain-containing protein n=1 Tax=Streptomyces sp. NBC_01210 TaxID=2903774 RepID=UPI003FA37E21